MILKFSLYYPLKEVGSIVMPRPGTRRVTGGEKGEGMRALGYAEND